MATNLTKSIVRHTEFEGVQVIVELAPVGLAFRLPGKRTRVRISWNHLLRMVPISEWCKDANRTLRMFLGIPGKAERKIEKKAEKRMKVENDKVKKLEAENKELKSKLAKVRRAIQ